MSRISLANGFLCGLNIVFATRGTYSLITHGWSPLRAILLLVSLAAAAVAFWAYHRSREGDVREAERHRSEVIAGYPPLSTMDYLYMFKVRHELGHLSRWQAWRIRRIVRRTERRRARLLAELAGEGS